MSISMQGNAPVVWAGDPEWRTVTTGMAAEIFEWVDAEARRRKLSRSELVRHMLIEAYARAR